MCIRDRLLTSSAANARGGLTSTSPGSRVPRRRATGGSLSPSRAVSLQRSLPDQARPRHSFRRSFTDQGPKVKDLVDEVLTATREAGRSAVEVFAAIDPKGGRVLSRSEVVSGLRGLDADALLDDRTTQDFDDFLSTFEEHGDSKVHMQNLENYCRERRRPPR